MSEMTLAEVEELFATAARDEVPAFADRYFYKKHGGTTDTARTRDEFE